MNADERFEAETAEVLAQTAFNKEQEELEMAAFGFCFKDDLNQIELAPQVEPLTALVLRPRVEHQPTILDVVLSRCLRVLRVPVNAIANIFSPAAGQRLVEITCIACTGEFHCQGLLLPCAHFYCGDCLDQYYMYSITDPSVIPLSCCQYNFDYDLVRPLLSERTCAALEPHPEERIACSACEDEVHPKNIVSMSCSHPYCIDCLEDLYQAASRDESLFPPRCCEALDYDLVKGALSKDTQAVFEMKSVEFTTQDRTYCSVAGCHEFIFPNSIAQDIAKCHECAQLTCAKCKTIYHEDQECPDPEVDAAARDIAERNGWQRCLCGRVIEMYWGCNHITCVCRREFCYVCGAEWPENQICPTGCPLWTPRMRELLALVPEPDHIPAAPPALNLPVRPMAPAPIIQARLAQPVIAADPRVRRIVIRDGRIGMEGGDVLLPRPPPIPRPALVLPPVAIAPRVRAAAPQPAVPAARCVHSFEKLIIEPDDEMRCPECRRDYEDYIWQCEHCRQIMCGTCRYRYQHRRINL